MATRKTTAVKQAEFADLVASAVIKRMSGDVQTVPFFGGSEVDYEQILKSQQKQITDLMQRVTALENQLGDQDENG